MTRFQCTFDRCRAEGRAALMPYMTAGDPSLEWTERLIEEVIEQGADMIELGMAYSDPIADGPTVQAAGQRALAAGVKIRDVFSLVRRVRSRHDLPIALLVYYNCIYRTGEEEFAREAAASGIDGLIVPDLPPEEAGRLSEAARRHGIDIVYLVAPTSTPERIRMIAASAGSFLYCVSLKGVTGARREIPVDLLDFLGRVRREVEAVGKSLPLAVGFGISTPEHVERIGAHADGVIVGSALIDRLHSRESIAAGVKACGELVRAMRESAARSRKERSA